jgi:hypothetical protein
MSRVFVFLHECTQAKADYLHIPKYSMLQTHNHDVHLTDAMRFDMLI